MSRPFVIPAIMSGGSGTRLWPLSRQGRPKQFHAFGAHHSMLSETLMRARDIPGCTLGAPVVLCNVAHRDAVHASLAEAGVPDYRLLLEPSAKNTAAAAAAACRHALSLGPDALVLLMPADHVIGDVVAFREVVGAGAPLALQGRIVTFGITPSAPETGFGYIEQGEPFGAGFVIKGFREKPDLATATRYFAGRTHYWNAGIFLLHARTYLDELARLRPDINVPVECAFTQAHSRDRELTLDPAAWAACAAESIDYAVAEKTALGIVLPAEIDWSDVGSWSAIHEISVPDHAGNAFVGDVIAVGSSNCYARAASERLIALVDCEDLVIVDTPDVVCVVPRGKTQGIKSLVERLRKERPHLL